VEGCELRMGLRHLDHVMIERDDGSRVRYGFLTSSVENCGGFRDGRKEMYL
jgi:hypothetical protein